MSIDHGKVLALADKWKALADTPHDVADDYNAGQIWAYAVAQAQLREALAKPAEAVDAWPKVVQDECLTVLRNMDAEMHVTSKWSARIRHLIDLIAGMKPAPTDAAQGAVAWQVRRTDGSPLACWEACTLEAYESTLRTGRYLGFENGPTCEVRALYTHPQAAPAQGDGWRLVPVEATDEMWKAFDSARSPTAQQTGPNEWTDTLPAMRSAKYAAMLAAAPSQEGES